MITEPAKSNHREAGHVVTETLGHLAEDKLSVHEGTKLMVFSRVSKHATLALQHLSQGLGVTLALAGMYGSGVMVTPALAQPNGSPAGQQTYLYGNSPQPDQPGHGYVVFQQRGSKVVGALYYPQSEFECFVGQIDDRQLAITVLEYGNQAPIQMDVSLSPLYQLDAMGASEHRSLAQCQVEIAVYEQTQQTVVQR